MSITLDPFSIFPKFVSLHVLSFLHPVELTECMLVSKKWNQLACHDYLWKPLLEVCTKNAIPTKNLKVWTLIIPNTEILLSKVYNLCRTIKLHQIVTFKCLSIGETAPLIQLILSCFKTYFREINIHHIFIPSVPVHSKKYLPWTTTPDYLHWREGGSLEPLLQDYSLNLLPPLQIWENKLFKKTQIIFSKKTNLHARLFNYYFIYNIDKVTGERLKEIYLKQKDKGCTIN